MKEVSPFHEDSIKGEESEYSIDEVIEQEMTYAMEQRKYIGRWGKRCDTAYEKCAVRHEKIAGWLQELKEVRNDKARA